LLEAGEVRLVLLDVLGREVAALAEGPFAAGLHSAQVDALSVAPGPYIARLQSGDAAVSRRVTVSR
jgi:hypothetical protein